MDHTINIEIELSLKIEVKNFRPGYPMPACSNPDNPRYDDQGEPDEYDAEIFIVEKIKKLYPKKVKELRKTKITGDFEDYILEKYDELICDECRRALDEKSI